MSSGSDDALRIVEYVLVAEFDQLKGNSLVCQYPSSIEGLSGEEQTIAELMLPDGVHKRDTDWTVFFLHRDLKPANFAPRPRLPTVVLPKLTPVQSALVTEPSLSASMRRSARLSISYQRPVSVMLDTIPTMLSLASSASDAAHAAAETAQALDAAGAASLSSPRHVSSSSLDQPPVWIMAYVYEYDATNPDEPEWVLATPEARYLQLDAMGISLENESDPSVFDLLIYAHASMEYRQVEPRFSAVLSHTGVPIGIRVDSDQSEALLHQFLDGVIRRYSAGSPTRSRSPSKAPSPDGGDSDVIRTLASSDGRSSPVPVAGSPLMGPATSGRSSPVTIVAPIPVPAGGRSSPAPAAPASGRASPVPGHAAATLLTPDARAAGIPPVTVTTAPAAKTKPAFLYCLNLCINQRDATVRRGASVKSMALCSRHPWISLFKVLLLMAVQKLFAAGTSVEGVAAELFNALNAADLRSMPVYTNAEKALLRSSRRKMEHFQAQVHFSGSKMSFRLPLTIYPDEMPEMSMINLIRKFGSQIMLIYHALITERRVLFVGRGCSANEVCEYVLAAVQFLCPPLSGILQKRAYPYTNLTNVMALLEVPGYIAGVTNAIFEEHSEWWDILCDITSGKVTVSERTVAALVAQGASLPDKLNSLDADLWNQIETSVASHFGEEGVRAILLDYTEQLTLMAIDQAEFADEQTRNAELEANRTRIELFKRSGQFQDFLRDDEARRALSTLDPSIPRWIRRLRVRARLRDDELMSAFGTFLKNIRTEEQLNEFLSYLPESKGGLYPVGVALFSNSQPVRHAAALLFRRIDKIQAGSGFISNLNLFLKLAYERIDSQLPPIDT